MRKIFWVLSISLFFTSAAWSHSGNTNSSGCHYDRINGGYHCHRSQESNAKETRSISSEDYEVAFNQKSKKFHQPNCMHAKACTVNCINLKKSEAIRRGGQPCGVCGG